MNIEKLLEIGSEWKNENHHRVYFNNIDDLAGLELGFYKSGAISWATLDDKRISNSRASKLTAHPYSKLFFDIKKESFESKHLNEEIEKLAIEKILKIIS